MEESERVPPTRFAAALDALDQTSLAEFAADIYRAGGNEVTADPPDLTVETGGETVRMRAVTAEFATPSGVDAVVSADPDIDAGCPVVGPADLRQRVLYALDPETAEELCERHLGQPARSPDYEPDGSAPADEPGTSDGVASTNSAPASTATADGPGVGPGTAAADRGPTGPAGPIQSADALSGTRLAGLAALVGPQAAVLGVLVVVVLATSVGAVLVGGLVDGGGDGPSIAGGATPTEQGPTTPTATPTSDQRTVTPLEGRDWGGWERLPNGLPSSGETATPTPESEGDRTVTDLEAERYADLRPTCERSFLHVVQIQMNALKYNDNETNDGIRTVRRFASPRNRKAIGPLSQYVRLIEGETYAPMLSYDSAEYEPSRFATEMADVGVTLRTNDTVTARYVFRLRKQDGGEYDGCWMTQGVRPVTDDHDSDVG